MCDFFFALGQSVASQCRTTKSHLWVCRPTCRLESSRGCWTWRSRLCPEWNMALGWNFRWRRLSTEKSIKLRFGSTRVYFSSSKPIRKRFNNFSALLQTHNEPNWKLWNFFFFFFCKNFVRYNVLPKHFYHLTKMKRNWAKKLWTKEAETAAREKEIREKRCNQFFNSSSHVVESISCWIEQWRIKEEKI